MSWPGQNWSDASRNAEGCQQTTEARKRHRSQEKDSSTGFMRERGPANAEVSDF